MSENRSIDLTSLSEFLGTDPNSDTAVTSHENILQIDGEYIDLYLPGKEALAIMDGEICEIVSIEDGAIEVRNAEMNGQPVFILDEEEAYAAGLL